MDNRNYPQKISIPSDRESQMSDQCDIATRSHGQESFLSLLMLRGPEATLPSSPLLPSHSVGSSSRSSESSWHHELGDKLPLEARSLHQEQPGPVSVMGKSDEITNTSEENTMQESVTTADPQSASRVLDSRFDSNVFASQIQFPISSATHKYASLVGLELSEPLRVELLDRFFSIMGSCYPLFHPNVLLDLIPGQPEMMLTCIYACATVFLSDCQADTQVQLMKEQDKYVSKLDHLVHYVHRPSYEVIVSFVLSSYFGFSIGLALTGFTSLSSATTLANLMGLNDEHRHPCSDPKESHLRRLIWWSIYELDRFAVISCGYTASIQSSPDDVSYPDPSVGLQDEFSAQFLDLWIQRLRLYTINTGIGILLDQESVFLPKSPSVAELTVLAKERTRLDFALNAWLETLPIQSRTFQSCLTTVNDTPPTEVQWCAASNLALYCCSLIHLHITCFVRALLSDLHDYNGNDPFFPRCMNAAVELVSLLRYMTRFNPFVRHMPLPIVGKALSRAAAMYGFARLSNEHPKWNLSIDEIQNVVEDSLAFIRKVKMDWAALEGDEDVLVKTIRYWNGSLSKDDIRKTKYILPNSRKRLQPHPLS